MRLRARGASASSSTTTLGPHRLLEDGHMIANLCRFLVLTLLVSVPAFSTSIFAIRTPTFIEIVTDSKARNIGVPDSVVCKIYRSGHSYFAVSGMRDITRKAGRSF